MISLIAAIGKNNELGKGNTLLFHIPADMKYFRETTSGHSVIMGRKTFESLKGPLPNRKNLVITRDKTYARDGVNVVHSLEEAVEKVKSEAEVFVIGGAEIYKQALSIADKLYITHIDAEDKDADAFFPEIIPIMWNEVKHEEHKKDGENPFNYTFSVYEKFI
ncbi:dihydrofolate reductase [Candidatus Nomurabacteria bacterium]|nr:dihydrofolate reductase [Candidatus Nomurabacteria bacterium]